MITITPEAHERLSKFLTDNKAPRNVRVFFPTASCGGSGLLSLTVDEPNEGDFSVTQGDIVYCINKKLQEVTGGVKIDFKDIGLDSGFIVNSDKILPVVDSDCGGCSGCC
jgi:Fe-S cluster assembly iron-binding protein IscA